MKVRYLQNITDVDDKIIQRAKKEQKNPRDFARTFTKAYLKDIKALGITAVDTYAPATRFIKEIVLQVQTLIKKDVAYEISGEGYYFDIAKFKRYGALARRTVAQAEDATSRVDESIKKKNKGDFSLWKFVSIKKQGSDIRDGKKKFIIVEGEPAWNTSLGLGRPGWHIEDTAISEHYFGPQYELHGGGLDLKFPHHEAEIAQQEAASGKRPFVRVWMHTGMLLVEKEKMSKSKGNFLTIRDILQAHSPPSLRLSVLQHHYRSPMNYESDSLVKASSAIDGIAQFLAKLDLIKKINPAGKECMRVSLYAKKFDDALADDMNTPLALAQIFSLINDAYGVIWRLNRSSIMDIERFIKTSLRTFGITLNKTNIPASVTKLAHTRNQHRTSQQFMHADRLRKKIEALGYTVEDTPVGPFVWPKK